MTKEQKIWSENYAKDVPYFLLMPREMGDVCTQTMSPLFGKKLSGNKLVCYTAVFSVVTERSCVAD